MPGIGIAFLSDVHGNAPALEAVLADARQRGASRFFNLGDSVGEAPFPNETIDLLRDNDVVSIRGNFDRNITEFETRIVRAAQRKHPARVAAIRHTHAAITPERLEYLRQLPTRRELEIEGLRFLLVHGSPRRDSEFCKAAAPDEVLELMAEGVQADVIACGHTHQPFVRRTNERLWINAGSAGRPIGSPRVTYVLARVQQGNIEAQPLRLSYPVQRVIAAIDALGLPAELRSVFLKGRYLP